MSIKPKINRDLNSANVHFGSKFGNFILDRWWMMARTSSKYGNFLLLSYIWPWSSRSITPQNNRDLNQGVLLFWSKFGNSNLNGWQVIARTSKVLPHTQTHRQTDAANDNTRKPNWPRVKITLILIFSWGSLDALELCTPRIHQTPVSGSCCLPLGALQSMWETWCKI